jgi:hypothetical protein
MTLDLFAARGTIIDDAVSATLAEAVRGRLTYARYALYDRGSYDHAEPREPELIAAVAALAAEVLGRELVVRSARAIRLLPGDYVLSRHDHAEAGVELMVDLSAAIVPGADVDYRRNGSVFFRMPSRPGAMSIVERGPGVACSHGYLSKRVPAEVVRLAVLLQHR